MAAAGAAFSFSSASSSSAALLRPGWAPLRRWRALARSTSSSPRSAASDEATVISGTKLAHQVLQEVRRDVESWISAGNQRPHLTVILVGDNPASHIYVRNKIKAAAAVGISSEIILRPKDISQEELLEMTAKLNKDSRVSGLLVQLPLPDHIDERTVCNAIAPGKDVDGFHIINVGRLCLDQPSIIPATAAAVWEIIKRTGIQTFGKNVLVAGRSKNVGMPISMLLHTDGEHERPGGDATVTITHRYTPKEQLKIHTQLADIVIVAAVDYTEQPKLLKLMQTCLEEHHSYCINGLCAFHSELRKPICKCLAGYNGERCEHLTLNSYAHNSYERYIAVGIGIGILTSGILAIIYYYVRKSCLHEGYRRGIGRSRWRAHSWEGLLCRKPESSWLPIASSPGHNSDPVVRAW
ncbi:probable bifunctional methylenetetrahydrofolate dehydrogenase/cyclohydrolase 2 isoform X5 [Cyanistes caeruleus]|uniref:probable bifunctional methylenetetrahydrofolate dehydrogenase/cyclohydrolase 2 isoform X5 n=1 Tax=Cyanistes caeruleus TaxID=156563 RepID=UPI000CDABE87|nr:probable bifunctional methylenetetrahydrofolate dehydrogenase/cyclohydrolase 2 isoform X5 [Cyanistes caeruleus]